MNVQAALARMAAPALMVSIDILALVLLDTLVQTVRVHQRLVCNFHFFKNLFPFYILFYKKLSIRSFQHWLIGLTKPK